MLAVSQEFLTAMNAPQREFEVFIETIFTAGEVTQVTGTGTAPANATNGIIEISDVVTVGSFVKSADSGWIGANTSDSNGVLTPESIDITYSQEMSLNNLWVIGRMGNYPVDFKIDKYDYTNSTWVNVLTVVGNTDYKWFNVSDSLGTAKRIRITISKISSAENKLHILECGIVHKLVFTKGLVTDFQLKEEAALEGNNPIGQVTSNELSLNVSNEYGWMAPTNMQSPLYGLIEPSIKITPHVGIKLPNNTFECVKLGTFYMEDWDADSSTIDAMVTAYDKLSRIMRKPVPNILPRANTTMKAMYETLFLSLGLTSDDFIIDDLINNKMRVGWITEGTVGQQLNNFALASFSSVLVDRDDKIHVYDMSKTATKFITLRDDDQIISFNNPQAFSNVTPIVRVWNNAPNLSDVMELAKIEDLSIPVGTTVFKDIKLSSPAGNVTYVYLARAVNSSVVGFTSGTLMADVTVTSSLAREEVDMIIMGQTISTTGVSVEASIPALANLWPDRILEVDSPFVQDEDIAKLYAQKLLTIAGDPRAYYRVTNTGNLAIEVMDTVGINSSEVLNNTHSIDAVVIRQVITYNGGIESELLLRKPIT